MAASVDIKDLKVILHRAKIGQDGEFASYLREFVAISNQEHHNLLQAKFIFRSKQILEWR